MRREPRVAGATVALAGVHPNCVVSVPTVSVSDVFAVDLVIFRKRIVRAKSSGIGGSDLLLAVNGEGAEPPQAVGLRPTTARLPTAPHR